MGLDDLLARLEERGSDTPDTSALLPQVSAQALPHQACSPDPSATPQNIHPSATAHHWLIHFAGREPLEVVCAPAENQATMLARYPAALKAEPFTPPLQLASSPLGGTDEAAMRAWLAHIGEIDPACISEVLGLCRQDAAALDYFLGRAREAAPAATHDERRTCAQCAQLNSRGQCLAARRGEIDAARNYSPVHDILRRCHAFVPKGEGYES